MRQTPTKERPERTKRSQADDKHENECQRGPYNSSARAGLTRPHRIETAQICAHPGRFLPKGERNRPNSVELGPDVPNIGTPSPDIGHVSPELAETGRAAGRRVGFPAAWAHWSPVRLYFGGSGALGRVFPPAGRQAEGGRHVESSMPASPRADCLGTTRFVDPAPTEHRWGPFPGSLFAPTTSATGRSCVRVCCGVLAGHRLSEDHQSVHLCESLPLIVSVWSGSHAPEAVRAPSDLSEAELATRAASAPTSPSFPRLPPHRRPLRAPLRRRPRHAQVRVHPQRPPESNRCGRSF